MMWESYCCGVVLWVILRVLTMMEQSKSILVADLLKFNPAIVPGLANRLRGRRWVIGKDVRFNKLNLNISSAGEIKVGPR